MIAVVMILGSSVLTAWASGDIAFPAILCMLGLLGVLRRFTWDIRPERHFIAPLLLLLLAVLFALHCRYAHVRADQAAAFAWQTIARYFLASMILVLFLRPHGTAAARRSDFGFRISDFGWKETLAPDPQSTIGLPPSLGLFHLASAMAAGQVLLLDDRYVIFRLSELLSVILVILYAVTASSPVVGSRTPVVGGLPAANSGLPTTGYRLPLCLSALLVVAVNLGWISGSLLYRHMEIINFLPAWLSRGSVSLESTTAGTARVGFSTSGKLSTVLSIKEDADSAPVLSITGSNPTYLRAMAFETYNQSAWHDLSYREAISPEQNTPFGMLLAGRTYLFRLHEADAPREVIIRHESSVGDAMFTPLGTCFVEAPFSLMMRDDDDTVNSPNVRNRQSYRAGYAASTGSRSPTGSQLRRLTAIPNQLDPRIRPTANRIFRDCTTTAEKIDAVTRYFHTNYTYVLGLEVPADRDALNYFLLEASSGYCEYFASGAAVLLRLVGVPARYVTGFVVTERGDDGRSWVARNMDAHAWVEAWDREQGQWTIVEATAQEGLDDASLADELARGAGGRRPFLTQLVESLYEYGLFGVAGRLFASYGLLTGGLLSMASFGAALWVFIARRGSLGTRRGKATRGSGAASDERRAALHGLLTAMDRKTRALGYRRNPDETLHAFADRICRPVHDGSPLAAVGCALHTNNRRGREKVVCSAHPTNRIAAWYLEYAGLRYCRVADPGRIEQLQRTAEKLR
jgi:hypothetical protein